MNEVAFIVNKKSKLYENYMAEKVEREKCWELLKKFIKDNIGEHLVDKYLILRRDLALSLTLEGYKQYKDSLKKDKVDEVYLFKKNSQINKLWNKIFDENINGSKLHANRIWYWDYMTHGTYKMFDYKDIVYGYLKGNYELKDSVMTEIKMSEYYKVIEEMENEK